MNKSEGNECKLIRFRETTNVCEVECHVEQERLSGDRSGQQTDHCCSRVFVVCSEIAKILIPKKRKSFV